MKITAQRMREVGEVIKKELPGKGYALIVFDFGSGLRDFSYLSNSQRQDMIATLESILIKWKNEKAENN